MSLQIRYVDAPEGAQENMQVSTAGESVFSDVSYLAAGLSTPWATLEPGEWVLDGSRTIMPDNPVAAWWSDVPSDDNGHFANHPKLTFKFDSPYTSTGLAFTFSPITDQWCSEIKVFWYNGQTLLAEGTYYPDSAEWMLQQTVESFDQIIVEILATNKPHHFAKIQMFGLSREILFGREEIVEVRVLNEVDPSLCELSADTMSITVRDNNGLNLIPQENQTVEIIKDGEVFASQYIKSSTREQGNVYRINTQSAVGQLNDTFLGGVYTAEPVNRILGDILGEWPFLLHQSFVNSSISGYLPVCTQREALQQVAFALGAVITTQGSGTIQLNPVPETVSKVFGKSQIFLGGKVEKSPRIAKVEVASHSYNPSEEAETILYDEYIDGENVLLTFGEPHHSYEITGGNLMEFGDNWVRVSANGAVTITARKYTHNIVNYAKRNPFAQAKEQGNTVSVASATLVNPENVEIVLNRLYEASVLRTKLKQESVISGHKAGDKVSSINPWGTQTRGFITSMESTLTQNGHTANVTILGVEVSMEGVHYYSGQLYSGDKEVLY